MNGHARKRTEMLTVFWWGKVDRWNHLEEVEIGGRILLKWILQNS
jgi:hypothetical protein